MARSPRVLIFSAVVAAVAVAGVIGWGVALSGTVVRYYMPGVLGRERVRLTYALSTQPDGGRQTADGSSAETTDGRRQAAAATQMADGGRRRADSELSSDVRHLTSGSSKLSSDVRPPPSGFLTRAIGLRPGAEEAWGLHNGITPALNFGHHLAAVFPPGLYKTHPEFFPLIEGKRFEPAPNSYHWNPDLAREDVARHAAEAAIAAFRRVPSAVSFSLGINDSVVFGDSAEARALLKNAEKLKTETLKSEGAGGTPTEPRAARNAVPSERDSLPTLYRANATVCQSWNAEIGAGGTPGATPSRGKAETLKRSEMLKSEDGEPIGDGSDSDISDFQHFRFSAFPPGAPRPVRWFRARPDLSPVVFTFMNRAAAIVAQEFPDKYLGCLAYYWCENAPPFAVDPHVIPFLTADRSQFYDPAFKREEFLLQERWGEALGARNAETLYRANATVCQRWNAEMGAGGTPAVTPSRGRAVPSERDSLPKLCRANATVSQTEMLKSDDGVESPMPRTANAGPNVSDVSQEFKRGVRQPEVRYRESEFGNFSFSAFQRFSISPKAPPRRLGLYDYLDGYGFLVPRVPIHAFAENVKHAHEVGFTDYYGESSRNWGLDGPLPWVIAQLLQNPAQPLEPLLDEYYTQYFREAAVPMRKFFERCEEQWMRQPGPSYWLKYYRSQSQADLFPSAVCAELRRLLDDAAARAKSARVRQRVAFVSDAFGLTERFVAFEEAREALARLVLADERAILRTDGRRQMADVAETADGGRQRADAAAQMADGRRRRADSEQVPALTLLRRAYGGQASRATPERSSDVRRLPSGSSTLSSDVRRPPSGLAALLAGYRARRREFIRYGFELARRQPLAFYPLNYADWLRDDPAFAAEVALRAATARPNAEMLYRANATVSQTEKLKLKDGEPIRDASDPNISAFQHVSVSAFPGGGGCRRPEAAAELQVGKLEGSKISDQAGRLEYEGDGSRQAATGAGSEISAFVRSPAQRAPGLSHPSASLQGAASGAPSSRDALRQHVSVSAFPGGGSAPQRLPFSGPVRPGLRMLGLQYGIDLPAPWQSRVEPRQEGVAELRTAEDSTAETSDGRRRTADSEALSSDVGRLPSGSSELSSDVRDPSSGTDAPRQYVHLSGQEIATFYQWRRALPGTFYAVSARIRGRVRSADAEMITLAWLDAQQRPIGTPVAMRLPTGEWPDWVTLRQGQRAPANAVWLGVAYYAQHQVADDFVDVGDIVLEEQDHLRGERLKG